ncbi:hypothetical protein, partial [Vibrio campbellii]|uniref:hypothetical protein n=1 Tax=Vibrio campbellii TaxID=680 RepID=UPI001E4684F5
PLLLNCSCNNGADHTFLILNFLLKRHFADKGISSNAHGGIFASICILQMRFAKCVLNKAPICIRIEEKRRF